ncbi:hypothetical protein DC3_13810 [Deinococcus cellulosilyticus NBRC 106333 = KACC 11606]|uniref:SHOCT domain-containing protein n=1 Tax=Deinococcus cellulosilyticus (strain DSM 18568 / NBRC 106333 / KACC 11606 / 5516J-15) TaxID=1223518 RepID=A0A511N026_DEIC1|nr:hypothetical protein DC3_13810 [Deinococcus cellulosilyticus NBRC 106333 = KACC 11606]
MKLQRTCRQCLTEWTVDKAHEDRLSKEASDVGGMVTDIMNVDLGKMVRNRFKIGLSQSSRENTTLSNRAIASQELKSMRRCPSCRTPDYFDERRIEITEDVIFGAAPEAAPSPAPVLTSQSPAAPSTAAAVTASRAEPEVPMGTTGPLKSVNDFLQELDNLLDLLTTGKISSEEYSQRRQQIMKFIEMV